MKPIRVFYSIYVPSGRTRILLDAMRLIANPAAKHSAHITVRGPYQDYQDSRDWSAVVLGQKIHIGGVGTFFGPGQHTVLLKVESPAIQKVWHKPDYPGYNPHITIYDGDSPTFAESLRDVLEAQELGFDFHATGLDPLVSGNGRPPLREWYDPEQLAPYLGCSISLDEIDGAGETTRLGWIVTLAEQLDYQACSR
jgi:hypothetical protein